MVSTMTKDTQHELDTPDTWTPLSAALTSVINKLRLQAEPNKTASTPLQGLEEAEEEIRARQIGDYSGRITPPADFRKTTDHPKEACA